MRPQCNAAELRIEGLGRRQVAARFDGGRMSSDGGAVLLREADRIVGVTAKLASCFTDFRDPARVEHDLEALVAQRVYSLALGYEDLNDHDVLRDDSVLALALGREDITGATRSRSRDRGHPLAGSTTLNRLELGDDATAAVHRYKRIVADGAAIDAQMVALFVAMQATAPAEIVLDLDATDAPVHGAQEGRFFHGYYGCYCYLPLYITCGDHVLRCRLRPANVDPAAGSIDALATVVQQIRAHWPDTAIMVRADSGFCREALMSWCESHDVDFVLGVAKSSRLRARIARQLERSRRRCLARGKASRRYRSFRFRTRKSWSRSRRVVGKAEWLPGGNGANPRFVVTSLPAARFAARALYEDLYCARGDMEVHKTGAEVVAEFDSLLSDHTEGDIATILNQRGYRTGHGHAFNQMSVKVVQVNYALKPRRDQPRRDQPRCDQPRCDQPRCDRLSERGLLTTSQVAGRLGVSEDTVRRWHRAGLLHGHPRNDRHGSSMFEIPDPPPTIKPKPYPKQRRSPSLPTNGVVEVQYGTYS